MNNKLVLKFLSFSYGSWIGLILGLLSTMVTTRLLAPEDFGKASMYTLALNICMIITIVGTDQSFVRFFYEEKEENRGGLLYNCLKFPIILTIVLSVVVFFLYEKITFFLFGDRSILIAFVLIIGIVIQMFYRYSRLVIRMQQKANLYSVLDILQRLFNLLLLLILFAITGASYRIVVFSTLFTTILLTILAVFFGRRLWSTKNFFKKNLTHSKVEILKYGSPFILTIFITWVFQVFDKFSLRLWGDFEELGLYSAAYNIIALLVVLQTTFSTFWTPVSYEKYENNPNDKSFFVRVTNIISMAMFSVAIITILGKDIIVLFLGEDFKEASTIMPFLVFMPVLYTLSETTVIGINFLKKTKWHILIASIACLFNIIGNWILVPDYGALGASISTAFSYVVFFTLRTYFSLKFYNVEYNLKKIYLMLIVITLYALVAIKIEDNVINVIIGVVSFILLIILYKRDFLSFFKVLKNIINKVKNYK
jgi:O-antigen/teichoic acid export membrane protein